MSLSNKAISEFQTIYKSVYGFEIAADKAENMGLDFLSFFKLIYREVPAYDLDRLNMYKSGKSIYKYN